MIEKHCPTPGCGFQAGHEKEHPCGKPGEWDEEDQALADPQATWEEENAALRARLEAAEHHSAMYMRERDDACTLLGEARAKLEASQVEAQRWYDCGVKLGGEYEVLSARTRSVAGKLREEAGYCQPSQFKQRDRLNELADELEGA